MAAKLQKYINYVKEAFMMPVHLLGLGIATVVTIVLMIIMGTVFGLAPWSLIMVLGALELMYLGAMTSNDRFVRAVNSKHTSEIQAYQKKKTITQYYNSLTAPRQRRFEHFKAKLDDIRENYQNLHGNYPSIVNGFLSKINNLQLSYIKLLFMQDKFPSFLEGETPMDIHKQIKALENSMKLDSGKLKQIKQKRIKLMEKRIEAYDKAAENSKIVNAQLMTIEEMVQFIKDQPVTLKSTDSEDLIIDNILFETEQMQDTISDIESIMSSDYLVGDYGSMDDSGAETIGDEVKS